MNSAFLSKNEIFLFAANLMQDGCAALMLAADNGYVDVVQCLVGAGANHEAADYVSGHVVWQHVDV